MLRWQVPVQTSADVLQPNSQPDGQVGLPAEQRQHSPEREERRLSPPLRQPATKGRSPDPFQAVKVLTHREQVHWANHFHICI